jgi:hypothetical protein
MSKRFLLAVVRANGTRWNVELSNRTDAEIFVARGAALKWLESTVSNEMPVQALIYRPSSDALEEAWFFEKGARRKLEIVTSP